MLGLSFADTGRASRQILCLGAHPDDIEIGCGGTMVELVAAYPRARVTWVVFSGDGPRRAEAQQGARRFLAGAGRWEVVVHDFRDGFFPSQIADVKEVFETLKRTLAPDLVLTHGRHDRHQDHRVISDLTWNTWRNHLIVEYEIPKYDGDLGAPNLFVPVSAAAARRKARTLHSVFRTQRGHHWFTSDVFLGLMRLRGVECCSPSGYAEAFYARKAVVVPTPRRRAGRRARAAAS